MVLAVLVDVADSVRLRLSTPSRITVNMSYISCDAARTREKREVTFHGGTST